MYTSHLKLFKGGGVTPKIVKFYVKEICGKVIYIDKE